jgi:hypothetical protein
VGDNTGKHETRPCIARTVPRATPTSIFSSLGEIGDRMKQIRDEEDAARAGDTGPFAIG